MWIARDEDGTLYAYRNEPKKFKRSYGNDFLYDAWIRLHPDEFPEITFESGPVEITSLKQVKQ